MVQETGRFHQKKKKNVEGIEMFGLAGTYVAQSRALMVCTWLPVTRFRIPALRNPVRALTTFTALVRGHQITFRFYDICTKLASSEEVSCQWGLHFLPWRPFLGPISESSDRPQSTCNPTSTFTGMSLSAQQQESVMLTDLVVMPESDTITDQLYEERWGLWYKLDVR